MLCFTHLNSWLGFPDNGGLLLDFVHELCIGYMQPVGDLPEGIDSRVAAAFFYIGKHSLTDT